MAPWNLSFPAINGHEHQFLPFRALLWNNLSRTCSSFCSLFQFCSMLFVDVDYCCEVDNLIIQVPWGNLFHVWTNYFQQSFSSSFLQRHHHLLIQSPSLLRRTALYLWQGVPWLLFMWGCSLLGDSQNHKSCQSFLFCYKGVVICCLYQTIVFLQLAQILWLKQLAYRNRIVRRNIYAIAAHANLPSALKWTSISLSSKFSIIFFFININYLI